MIHETIKDLVVPLVDLHPYERNPRRGKVEVVKESLETNGQYRPIVVNRPGSVILAGNHTWHAARELGWEEIAATFVDVDDGTAKKILIIDNRASDLATNDNEVLAEVLGELEDLAGTGYTEDDVAKLLGSAEPDVEEFASRFEVVVECDDEDQQQEIYDRLTGEGLSCRVLSL